MHRSTKITMKTSAGFTSRKFTLYSAKSAYFDYKYCTLISSLAFMQGMQAARLCTTHMTLSSNFVAVPSDMHIEYTCSLLARNLYLDFVAVWLSHYSSHGNGLHTAEVFFTNKYEAAKDYEIVL